MRIALSFIIAFLQFVSVSYCSVFTDTIPEISNKLIQQNEIAIQSTRRQFPGIHLDELSTAKYFCGDNPLFAKNEFNDSGWEQLQNTEARFFDAEKIYWCRVKFQVDSDLTNNPLVLCIYWQGAMQIYLNGEIVYAYGSITDSSSDQLIHDADYFPMRRVTLKFQGGSEGEVLAFRFGQHSNFSHINSGEVLTTAPSIALTLHSLQSNESIEISQINTVLYYGFFLGANGIIMLLAIFQIKRKQKNKTWMLFGLFTFFTCYVAMSNFIDRGAFTLSTHTVLGIAIFNYLAYSLSVYFLLLVMRSLFDKTNKITPWIYSAIAGIMVSSFYSYTFYGLDLNYVGLAMLIMALIELLRLSYLSVRNRVSGSWIIITGALIFIIAGPILEQYYTAVHAARPFWATVALRISYYLSMPVSLSIFLASQALRNNRLLARQRDELDLEVQERTKQLKESQEELLKHEKLAAFGSVATRMAHEIQNPLNFVNNFSELSKELIDEIVQSKTEEEKNEAAVMLKENLDKINHHGRRASAIVNELEEHNRKGTTHEFFDGHEAGNANK